MMKLAYNHTNNDGTGRFVQRDESNNLHGFEVEKIRQPIIDGALRIWRVGPVIKAAGTLPDAAAARAWVVRG